MSAPALCQEYYHQHDMYRDKAFLTVKNTYEEARTPEELAANLREALELYAQDKGDGGFMANATEDQLRLITFQKKMSQKHGSKFQGLSVSDTLFLYVAGRGRGKCGRKREGKLWRTRRRGSRDDRRWEASPF